MKRCQTSGCVRSELGKTGFPHVDQHCQAHHETMFLSTAGIKRKKHFYKKTPHISKIQVVEGAGMEDELPSPWGW